MKIDRKNKLFILSQGLIDLAIVYYSYILAIIPFNATHPRILALNDFILIIPFILALSFIFFQVFNVFEYGEYGYIESYISVGLAGLLVNISAVVVAFGLNLTRIPSKLFIFAYLIQLGLFAVSKYLMTLAYSRTLTSKKVVLIGTEAARQAMSEKIEGLNRGEFQIKGQSSEIDDSLFAMAMEADAVFMLDNLSEKDKFKLFDFGIRQHKDIYVIPNNFEIALSQSRFILAGDMPVFLIRNNHLSSEQRFIKRTFDFIVSLLMIILTGPLMLISAMLIKLSDRGPVFFRQERVTRGGRVFQVIKFRTMIVDAEKESGPVLATEKDPRVTGLGAFMRMTRIDELPQLINVLKGDMSIVGPRPERPFFIEEISRDLPDFRQRLAVKAGITGLAQVSGKYSTLPEDKLKFDLMYITNYSLMLDLKILLKTLRVVFSRESHT
ncbi:MAG: sugar transferase [Tissierellales bacterium]|nr:sugar transferase [Tissierellales bacterium]